jgi:hypothetical protein
MKNYFIVLMILLSYNYSVCQTVQLHGRIVDEKTNSTLPFATIEIFSLKTGTCADKDGIFSLSVNSTHIDLDTIEFSCLGYEKRKISISDLIKEGNKTVSIKERPFILDEVIVIPKKFKTVKIGITDIKPQSKQITNLYNNKIGNFIENKGIKMGWINSVSFYIDKEGHPETPFRVRIYDVNKGINCPGNDILDKNLIVSARSSGWFTVDLKKYNIPFPADGIFVMMEWVNSGDGYFYDKEIIRRGDKGEQLKETRKFYGQAIGSVLKQPGMITWGVTLGNEWIPYKLYYKGYINAMINAEIAYPLD